MNMQDEKAQAGLAQREPKSHVLMDRIRGMESIVNRLQALRDKIIEGNVPRLSTGGEKGSDNPAPTLAIVLNEGPEQLQTSFNQMNDIISQIEQELF